MDGMNENIVNSFCVGYECEYGDDICCRDCGLREMCDDACDGPEGHGVDGECEWRV